MPVADARPDTASLLGTGRIGSLLFEYSLPAIVGTSVASLYNVIDRIFIGHGVGPMAISGLALTFPMMNLAAAFGALVGAGASALVSIRLGEGNRREADRILGNTVFLNLVLSTLYSVVCLLALDRILFAMGASHATLPYARQFMQVILVGNVFTHLYLGLNNVMRASGYPRKAMRTTLLAVGINIALAPLFIFVFHWGIRGAAFATVVAQVLATLRCLLHFLNKDAGVRFVKGCMRPDPRIVRDIFSVGMSNFTLLFCSSFVAVAYNMRLAVYGGDYAIGAFGIINSLGNLAVMITAGLNQGMQPIAGYNFGARQFDRVRRVFRLALIAATCITTAYFVMAQAIPHWIAAAFTNDAQLIAQSVTGMRIAFAVFPVVGLQIVTSAFFQAIGKAKISIVLSLTRQVLFLIPGLIVLPWFFSLNGIWVAEPVADLAASVVAIVILRTQFSKYVGAR
jgi:putative MATE family efflux protein